MRTLPLALVALAAACQTAQTGEEADPPSLSEDPRVGEKVDRLCFTRRINAFSEYGDAQGLILRQNVSDEYLVTFTGVCPALDFAQAVGLGPDLSGAGCLRRADRVFISDNLSGRSRTPFSTSSCLVSDIYRFDRDAERASGEAAE